MPKTSRQWGILLLFILISQAVGIIGSFFTLEAISTWYVGLEQPSFSPPNWVFGPVWTILYTLMGVSVYIVWQKRDGLSQALMRVRNRGLILFWVHLFFNGLWSILFFGLQNPLYALIDIAVLWVLLIVTALYFFRVSVPASLLLVPYIAWVSFASILNLAIVLLN